MGRVTMKVGNKVREACGDGNGEGNKVRESRGDITWSENHGEASRGGRENGTSTKLMIGGAIL